MPETNNKQTIDISWLSETPLNQEIKFSLTENPTEEELKEYIESIKNTRKQETDALAKEILGAWKTTEDLIAKLKQDIQASPVEDPSLASSEETPPQAWWDNWWWNESGKENEEAKNPLPLAPTTTFNILRLIQRGYIPISPVKPKEGKGFFGKTIQWAKYIYYWADLAFLKIQQWWKKSQEHGISKIYEKFWVNLTTSPYFTNVVKTEIDTISKELSAYESVNKPDLKKIERLQWEIATLRNIRWVLDKPWNNVSELRSLADEYIKSRWNYNPAGTWRKTPADITTENTNAEAKVRQAQQVIKDLETDLTAEKNGWKDSKGNIVKTENEIKNYYDEEKRKNIETLDKEIETETKNLQDAQQAKDKAIKELESNKALYYQKQDKLNELNTKIAWYDSETNLKWSESHWQSLHDNALKNIRPWKDSSAYNFAKQWLEQIQQKLREVRLLKQEINALNSSLQQLWQLDARQNVIVPATWTTTTLWDIKWDLDKAEVDYTDAETKLKVLDERKKIAWEVFDGLKKQRLEERQKKITLLEKREKNWKSITLPKRTSDEAKIRTINNEISVVQGKIAVIEQIDTDLGIAVRANNIPEAERLEALRNSKINQRQELLKRLWELRAQKNTVAQDFSSTGSKDKTTVDAEIALRQAELDKFNELKDTFEALNNKISALRQEAVNITNKINTPSADPKEALEFQNSGSKRIWEIASEINQLNIIWQEKFNGSGIHWTDIPALELAWLRKKNGFFAFMEKHAWAPTLDSSSWTWKFAKWWGYGMMKLVAISWIVRQGVHSGVALSKGQILAGTYDAADLALWFIPWIWWGTYDMLTWAQQLVMGKDIIGRKVESWAALTRLWFWALAFVTLWGSKYLELAVKGWKLAKLWINWARAISTADGIENITNVAKVTQKVATGAYWTFALVDMTGQLIKDPKTFITWVETPKTSIPKATWSY